MAASDYFVSVGQVTASVRFRGGYELDEGLSYDDDYISTGLMLDFVNSAYLECRGYMINADVDRFVVTGTLTTVGGNDLYPLPDDFYRLRGVDAMQGPGGDTTLGNEWFRLEPYGFAERDAYRSVRFQAAIPRYHVEGYNVRFAPAPQSLSNVVLWYVPRLTPGFLKSDDDLMDMVAGWEECVVQMCLKRCFDNQGRETASVERDLGRQIERLQNEARDRDRGSPKRAIDPRSAGGYLRRRRTAWSW